MSRLLSIMNLAKISSIQQKFMYVSANNNNIFFIRTDKVLQTGLFSSGALIGIVFHVNLISSTHADSTGVVWFPAQPKTHIEYRGVDWLQESLQNAILFLKNCFFGIRILADAADSSMCSDVWQGEKPWFPSTSFIFKRHR